MNRKTSSLILIVLLIATLYMFEHKTENVSGSVFKQRTLQVNEFFNATENGWTAIGVDPWLNASDGDTNCIYSDTGATQILGFAFEDLNTNTTSVSLVKIYLTLRSSSASQYAKFKINIWNMSVYAWVTDINMIGTSYFVISAVCPLYNTTQVNHANIEILTTAASAANGYVTYVKLVVDCQEGPGYVLWGVELQVWVSCTGSTSFGEVYFELWNGTDYLNVLTLTELPSTGVRYWYNITVDWMTKEMVNDTRLRLETDWMTNDFFVYWARLKATRFNTPNYLEVDAFVNQVKDWSTSGAEPWIDGNQSTWIGTQVDYKVMQYFTFEDLGAMAFGLESSGWGGLGADGWVIAEFKTYTYSVVLIGTGTNYVDTVRFRFYDGAETEIVSYIKNDSGTLTSGIIKGEDQLRVENEDITQLNSERFNVSLDFWFKKRLVDRWSARMQVRANDTSGADLGWILANETFNIYSQGGLSTMISTGNAGRLSGGDSFDLYASAYNVESASVEVTSYYRNLQHFKILPIISYIRRVSEPSSYFNLSYSVDYCFDALEGEWVTGWKLEILEGTQAAGSSRFFNWTVNSYFNDTLITSQNWYNYFYAESTVPSIGEYSYARFWTDLWFNKINASTTAGGRVNAYYYPMIDSANTWLQWLTGSNWGIDEKLQKQAMFFTDLKDADGTVASTLQIEMVRIGCKLQLTNNQGRDPADQLYVKVSDYDVFDLTLGGDPFTGVQTPVFDETRVPIMPQGGFLGSVISWFQGAIVWLADNMLYGGLDLWGNFIAFMDTIAAWLGYPGFFTNLSIWLGNFWNWMLSSFGWLISFLTSTFTFLVSFMAKMVNTTSTALTIFTSMIGFFFAIIDGTYTGVVNSWDTLGLTHWVTLFFILYPVWLLVLWEEKGLDAMITHLRNVLDVFAFIGSIFISVIQLTLNLIGRIIESIPVVE